MSYSPTQQKTAYAAENSVQGMATLLSAATVTGDEVRNLQDETLGKIQDIMLDMVEGKIVYAVLASGGILGMGGQLFAIPWKALRLDKQNHRFMLDVDVDRLKSAPGFDKDQWPDMADPAWYSAVESYYTR